MAATGFDYFDALERQAGFAVEMACNLKSGAHGSELGTRNLIDALHTIENDADQVNHEIHAHLIGDFVVPLERDGVDRLANALDDVSDAVEEVAIGAYMFNRTRIPDAAFGMLDMTVEACVELQSAVAMLRHYSHDATPIKNILVRVQTLESDCDRVYIEAVRALYLDESMADVERRCDHKLLSLVEAAMDAMEHAAESVEAVVATNL